MYPFGIIHVSSAFQYTIREVHLASRNHLAFPNPHQELSQRGKKNNIFRDPATENDTSLPPCSYYW